MAQEEKSKKKNRLSYMILSVIIAIIAWTLVVSITDPEISEKFTGIQIELTGEDILAENGFVIVNRDKISNTSLKMSGRRSALMKNLDKARVIADVSHIKESGEFKVETASKLPNASGVSADKIGAETVTVVVERIQSKEVPIRVIQIGKLEGKLVKTEPIKETVEIQGALADLEYIEAVEIKADITGITSGDKTSLPYTLILQEDTELEDLHTIIIKEDTVKLQNTVYDEKELPVTVRAKSETTHSLSADETRVEPQLVKIGVMSGVNIDSVTVTIEENSGEGDYKLDNTEGVYIPESRATVHVKPKWN